MGEHDVAITLQQMLDHAREAVDFARETDRPGLEKDRKTFHALVRLVEVIGEAARRVPKDIRSAHPGIPWEDVVGMRNRLIHGYDTVDLDILWGVLEGDLPELVHQLETILGE